MFSGGGSSVGVGSDGGVEVAVGSGASVGVGSAGGEGVGVDGGGVSVADGDSPASVGLASDTGGGVEVGVSLSFGSSGGLQPATPSSTIRKATDSNIRRFDNTSFIVTAPAFNAYQPDAAGGTVKPIGA